MKKLPILREDSDENADWIKRARPDAKAQELSACAAATAQLRGKSKANEDNPYGDDGCPFCGKHAVGSCRCSGPHSMEDLKKGHGRHCPNGHNFSGGLGYDPSTGKFKSDGTAHQPTGETFVDHVNEGLLTGWKWVANAGEPCGESYIDPNKTCHVGEGEPVKESKSKFDAAEWLAKPVPDRLKEWNAQSQAKRDEIADAPVSIPKREAELLKPLGEWPKESGDNKADCAARIAQANEHVTNYAAGKLKVQLDRFDSLLTEAGVPPKVATQLHRMGTDTLIAQEMEAMSRTLGDHGISHIGGNIDRALKMIDVVPGVDTAQDKLAIVTANIWHDSGYLTEPSRNFLDEGHPRWSTENYNAHVKPLLSQSLGNRWAGEVEHMIRTHDATNIDWVEDAPGSAVRVADNTGLFMRDKLPPLFRHVPQNIAVLRKLSNKELDVTQAREAMAANVDKADYPEPIKESLRRAVKEVNPITGKFTLGMMGGNIEGVSWDKDHVKITLREDKLLTQLHKIGDFGQRQFGKFAETYGVDPAQFKTDLNFAFKNKAGKTLLSSQIVGQHGNEGGDNCGTGDGGFKPGNTCARGAESGKDNPAFKAWFHGSKVVDANGEPLVVYHGTKRPDRIGDVFRKSRATSGPMSFFTTDPEIASNYAKSKSDTSLEQPADYAEWFKVKVGRTEVPIDRAWHYLSADEKNEATKKLFTTGYENPDNSEGEIVGTSGSIMGKDGIEWQLKQSRGNALHAAKEIWLNSGALYGQEEKFQDVLKAMGVKNARLDDPNAEYPAVMPVYLSIKNPLDTDAVPKEVIKSLEIAASRQRTPPQAYGADQWDKRTQNPREWVAMLKDEKFSSSAWTSIPDWVTKTLKAHGYDGINDTGGRVTGGPQHKVWIPFEETQVKSATGNKGTYRSDKRSIVNEQQGQHFVWQNEDFDESKHPRDSDGRFAPGNGGTETKEFKEWFGDSKVVDSDGKPLVAYHGTIKNIEQFRTKYAAVGKPRPYWLGDLGAWFATKAQSGEGDPGDEQFVAGSFTENRHAIVGAPDEYKEGANVMPVYLSIKNPLEVWDYNELLEARSDEGSTQKLRRYLEKQGFDGIVVRNSDTDGSVIRDDWIAFHPHQIKSVFNKGTWSKADPHISNEGIPCGQSWISADKECHEGEAGDATSLKHAPKGFEFVSPNVTEDMRLDEAIRSLRSDRQTALVDYEKTIDEKFGLEGKYQAAVGDWADGAENTVVATYKVPPTWAELEANAALKGLAADQKAVIPFLVQKDGKSFLHEVTLKSDLRTAREIVANAGIENRTLVPVAGGTKVMVFDEHGTLGKTLKTLANENNTTHIFFRGRGEFLGSFASRDEGIAKYRDAIARFGLDEERGGSDGKRRLRGGDITGLLRSAEQKREYALGETPEERVGARSARELRVPGERNGVVTLKHWSQLDLSGGKIDPSKHGTGLAGEEAKRKRDYPELYQDRSYFGLTGYNREPGLGSKLHEVKVPAKALYDAELDPLGLDHKVRKEMEATGKFGKFDEVAAHTLHEKAIKDAGYLGYFSRSRNVAALFHAVPGSGSVKRWKGIPNETPLVGNYGVWEVEFANRGIPCGDSFISEDKECHKGQVRLKSSRTHSLKHVLDEYGEDASAKAFAEQIVAVAKLEEPQTTADLQKSVTAAGGELVGLKNRLKEAESLAGKIERKAMQKEMSRKQYAIRVGDALRYTALIPADKYVEGVKRIQKELEANGYKLEGKENKWADPAYKGLHYSLRTKRGLTAEIQFHTPESIKAKSEGHVLYKQVRGNKNPSFVERLTTQMANIWRRVTVPQGVFSI